MAGVNKVIILGRLGQDPELRMTSGNQQVCSFSVATSESWLKDGKKEERTEWHKIVAWGRLADLASKYLKKGRNVYLEGRMQTRSWDDKEGQKRYTTEIVANNLVFVDSAGGGKSDHGDAGDFSSNSSEQFSGNASQFGGYDSPAPRAYSPASNTGSNSNSKNTDSDEDVPF